MNLAEAQAITEQLRTAFANIVINSSGEAPAVLARDQNRAWRPARVLHTRLEHKLRVITEPRPHYAPVAKHGYVSRAVAD